MIALVQKFIDNSISEEELIQLKAWLQDADHKVLFDQYIKDAHDLHMVFSKANPDASFKKVMSVINEQSKPTRTMWPNMLKYAAALFIFMSAVFGFYRISLSENSIVDIKSSSEITLEFEEAGEVQTLDVTKQAYFSAIKGKNNIKQEYTKLVYDNAEEIGRELVYNKLSVPYGKRFEVVLSDGTSVFLNAGSVLRYPVAFNDPENRKVFLEGEGFFNVMKNKEKPFLVETNNVTVRVLGTKFNVSSYANEANNSIVLQEGSVLITSKSENEVAPLQMLPGQQVLEINGKLLVNEVNVQKHMAWIDGSLLFVNDRFENIIQELERHYAIKIINENKDLNHQRYTGTFKDETLEEILNIFKENTNFEFRIENEIVTIK